MVIVSVFENGKKIKEICTQYVYVNYSGKYINAFNGIDWQTEASGFQDVSLSIENGIVHYLVNMAEEKSLLSLTEKSKEILKNKGL